MVNFSKKTISLAITSILTQFSQAADIDKIQLIGLDNNDRIVKIHFREAVVIPQASALVKTPRITMIFPRTRSLLKRSQFTYNDSVLSRINLEKFDKEDTRVIVEAKDKAQYRLSKKADGIWLYIHPTPGSSNNTTATQPPLASTSVITTKVQSSLQQKDSSKAAATTNHQSNSNTNTLTIDYQGNKQGGSVTLLLNHAHRPPKMKQSGNRLEMVLEDYKPASSTQNVYDLSEYNSALKKIEVKRQGNDAVVYFYNQGDAWDYQLHDNGAQLVVDFKDNSGFLDDQIGNHPHVIYKGGKISFDFQDVDVRTVLQILAKEAGVNIIVSDLVKGSLTLKLKDVRWDEALDLVLQTKDLSMTKVGSIINVAPKSELEARDKREMELEQAQSEKGNLRSRSFRLSYKNVRTVAEMLTGGDQNGKGANTILSKRGSVIYDAQTNTLIVADTPASLKRVANIIQEVDIPSDQVMISARIVEVKDNDARSIGMQLRLGGESPHGNTVYSGVGSGDRIDDLPPNIDFPMATGQGFSGFSFFHTNKTALINLIVTAMEEEGKAKIVSSPKVLTLNGEEATLEDGVDVPYRVKQEKDSGYSTQFKRAVTSLRVKPQITPEGNVILDIHVKKDSPNGNDGSISVKNLDTRAMVADGSTLILGGIYDESSIDSVQKVPVLGDLPIIGNLFKTKTHNGNKREVLIFLTPKVVRSNVSGKLVY